MSVPAGYVECPKTELDTVAWCAEYSCNAPWGGLGSPCEGLEGQF